MNRHLFIGGPADGEWKEVERERELWRVAELPPVRFDPYSPLDSSQLITYKEHVYFRRYWRDDDSNRIHTFYVHSDVPLSSVFSLLIAGYRQPAPKVEA
jgi:hypothetical protein